jgi:hypothetical protein
MHRSKSSATYFDSAERFGQVALDFDVAAGGRTVELRVVLQGALAAAIAYRAVQRVVD